MSWLLRYSSKDLLKLVDEKARNGKLAFVCFSNNVAENMVSGCGHGEAEKVKAFGQSCASGRARGARQGVQPQ